MKKTIVLGILLAMLSTLFTGCALISLVAREDAPVIKAQQAGIILPQSKTYLAHEDSLFLYTESAELRDGLYAFYSILYPENYETLSSYDRSTFNTVKRQAYVPLVLYRTDNSWNYEDLSAWIQSNEGIDVSLLREVHQGDGYAIYAYQDKELSDELPAEKKPLFEAIGKELLDATSKIVLSDPVTLEEGVIGQTLSFSTVDFEGNPISSKDLFSKNKVTMINCWASWCGPCISELPDLQALLESHKDQGFGLVGVLTDAGQGNGLQDAKEILQSAGCTYLNIEPWETFRDDLPVIYIPSTVFVDEKGTILGEMIVGADPAAYEQAIQKFLLGGN